MNVELLPAQLKMLTCDKPAAAYVGGIGAGKTHTLAHFVLKMFAEYPSAQGLIVANTYSQLQNATIPAIVRLFEDLGVKYEITLSGAKKYISALGAKALIYSLDVPDNIRGIEVGWIAGDEVAYSSKEAINVISGRLRDKNGPLYARYFTSPKGFNFFYDFINKNGVELYTQKTKDNHFLPPQYIQQLVELYGGEDSPLARQELFGEFVNLTAGAVYFAFKRDMHLAPVKPHPLLPVYCGMDFNVDNMSLVFVQKEKEQFRVIEAKSLTSNNANTFDASLYIKQHYSPKYQVFIIPDSTGKARTTKSQSSKSDIQILKEVGLHVMETQNPRIKDRQNTVNMHLIKGNLIIDNKQTDLIKELETLSHDDVEGSNSHLAVALGYVLWKLAPLKPPTPESKSIINPFIK